MCIIYLFMACILDLILYDIIVLKNFGIFAMQIIDYSHTAYTNDILQIELLNL